ncbi:hypothetical protein L211DRAFT_646454 [Terfezia boudieri ATCC MYA-4762]|uniref:RING zinc finger-like domain-containing protein n=1 Tax=Terfezia boudieri ATCC MYA-4762 TaxID=1051890 RepID=A0A3N4M158_9PEZI|nr:hypothetical protein L211DRAFT_646454 [Terfezia boudieri ATCC MYA-4762]
MPARRRTGDKKTSGTALLSSLAAGVDMMDVDTESTPRQHYIFNHGTGDFRNWNRQAHRGDELGSEEVGLILGSMNKEPQHVSDAHLGVPQLRRAYSFSVGDRNEPAAVAVGVRTNRGLSLNTTIPFEPDRQCMPVGPMSAGGVGVSMPTGGSRWDDLLEAAGAAAEENKILKKSPLLSHSVLPHVTGELRVPRQNINPYGPDLPAPLKMMIDVATAEADLNQIYREQRHVQNQHHTHPQNYMQNYVYTQHQYTPPTNMYHQQHPYGSHYQSYQHYSGHTSTTISPILNGTSLASLNSSNATSHASTPAYSKPSSPRAENVQHSPKIQCSLCRVHVEISMAFACTECINGFCHQCVPSPEISELEGDGLGGLSEMKIGSSPELEPQTADHVSKKRTVTKEKNQGARCGVCGVTGARYKPVRLIVRA